MACGKRRETLIVNKDEKKEGKKNVEEGKKLEREEWSTKKKEAK